MVDGIEGEKSVFPKQCTDLRKQFRVLDLC